MAKIICPNKQYTGISAGIGFIQGIGETTDSHLIDWFNNHGYEVIKDAAEEDLEVPPVNDGKELEDEIDFDEFTVEELKAYAELNGIDIGKSTSHEGILKKIIEATKEKIKE